MSDTPRVDKAWKYSGDSNAPGWALARKMEIEIAELEAEQAKLKKAYAAAEENRVTLNQHIAELEAKQPKAKTLVWEGNSIDQHKCSLGIFEFSILERSRDTILECIKYVSLSVYMNGAYVHGLDNITDAKTAKQAAQEWYDNYVANFIKENCE